MARFQPLDEPALTDRQREVAGRVRAGRRGTVPANVVAWLPSPELADRAAHLGEFVRYGTSLPPAQSEIAILVVARHWACEYEWAIHAGEAVRAGVPAGVIDAIGRGGDPRLTGTDGLVAAFARALVATGRVDDVVHAAALEAFGAAGVADLVGIVGYYTLVAFTLNASEVPAPPGSPGLPAVGPR
ncbi:MAG: carboxymuconolactone decarboxylase family protein [Vicinamibacterales bacterium]